MACFVSRHSSVLAPFVRIVVLAACTLLGACPAARAKGPVLIDEHWLHPAFSAHDPQQVAVIPAVGLFSPEPSHLTSDLFFNQFRSDGRAWLPPSVTWLRFGATPRERDSVFRAIVPEVRRDGHPDASMTSRLARLLKVDALVFLRIDRWEHVTNPAPSTQIEARAELLDSAGVVLWRSRARSRLFGESIRSSVEMPGASPGMTEPNAPPVVIASGSAGGSSGGGGSTMTSTSPGPATYSTHVQVPPKVERLSELTADDVHRMRPAAVSAADQPFEGAARALVSTWAALLPARAGSRVGPGSADSLSRPR